MRAGAQVNLSRARRPDYELSTQSDLRRVSNTFCNAGIQCPFSSPAVLIDFLPTALKSTAFLRGKKAALPKLVRPAETVPRRAVPCRASLCRVASAAPLSGCLRGAPGPPIAPGPPCRLSGPASAGRFVAPPTRPSGAGVSRPGPGAGVPRRGSQHAGAVARHKSLVGLVSCAGVSSISARAAAQRVREDPLSWTCITRAWLRLATLQRLSRAACHVTAKSAGQGIPRLSPSYSREVNQVQVAVSRNGWSEYDTKVTSHNIAFLQSS